MTDSKTPIANSNDDTYRRGVKAYEATDYDTAIALWTPLADAGHAEAQSRLGELYYYEFHDPHGPGYSDKAAHYLQLAADQNDAKAWYLKGHIHRHDGETPEDFAVAAQCYGKAMALGRTGASLWLGHMLLDGSLGEPDSEEALRQYRIAADGGDCLGMLAVARFLIKVEDSDDTAEGLRLLHEAVEDEDNGNLAAEWLGQIYIEGRYVPRDTDRAVYYYRRAQGVTGDVCFTLATILKDGDGVEAKPDEAAHWFYEAAREDHPQAVDQLCVMAESGNGEAQSHLVDCYQNGVGVEADEQKALNWEWEVMGHDTDPHRADNLIGSLLSISRPDLRHLRRFLYSMFIEELCDVAPALSVNVMDSMTQAAWKRFSIEHAKDNTGAPSDDDNLSALECVYGAALDLAKAGEISLTDADGEAWEAIATLYTWDDDTEPDPAAEIAFYTARAFGRDPVAQLALANIYSWEEDAPVDTEAAEHWIGLALTHSVTRQRAMWLRAGNHRWRTDPTDHVRAFIWTYAAFRNDREAAHHFNHATEHLMDLSNIDGADLTIMEGLLSKHEIEGFTMADVYGLLGDEELAPEGESTLADLFQAIDEAGADQVANVEIEGDGDTRVMSADEVDALASGDDDI